MMMFEHDEGVVLFKDQLGIIKGKRTKRHRPLSPPMTLALTSSSEESGGRVFASSSSAVTTISGESTEEDEDMANCLILLAQGQSQTRRAAAPIVGPTGPYECKTCKRSFSSFQALGGHRASHKRPKFEEKNAAVNSGGNFGVQFQSQFSTSTAVAALSLRNGNSNKVHECSICGAEFSSGQALGGHMRRHRTLAAPTTAAGVGSSGSELQGLKKSRNLLQLDLNLAPPEEELKFSFGSKERMLVFSSSNSLVNCHY